MRRRPCVYGWVSASRAPSRALRAVQPLSRRAVRQGSAAALASGDALPCALPATGGDWQDGQHGCAFFAACFITSRESSSRQILQVTPRHWLAVWRCFTVLPHDVIARGPYVPPAVRLWIGFMSHPSAREGRWRRCSTAA